MNASLYRQLWRRGRGTPRSKKRCEGLERKWTAEAGALGLLQKNERKGGSLLESEITNMTPLKPGWIKNFCGQGTLCQDILLRTFHVLDLIIAKVLQGHYHSHFAAEETDTQARKWQIQECAQECLRKCVFALLTTPELSFLTPFHAVFLFFSQLLSQLAILSKKWLTGRFLGKW